MLRGFFLVITIELVSKFNQEHYLRFDMLVIQYINNFIVVLVLH